MNNAIEFFKKSINLSDTSVIRRAQQPSRSTTSSIQKPVTKTIRQDSVVRSNSQNGNNQNNNQNNNNNNQNDNNNNNNQNNGNNNNNRNNRNNNWKNSRNSSNGTSAYFPAGPPLILTTPPPALVNTNMPVDTSSNLSSTDIFMQIALPIAFFSFMSVFCLFLIIMVVILVPRV
jgi:hypothetical protein